MSNVFYPVIYVDAIGRKHVEVRDAGSAEAAIAYAKDPAHWPGHLIARRVTVEDLYDNDAE